MSNFSWTYLINKTLNLAVLVFVCFYLVNKYVIPYITKALKSREKQLSDLKKEIIDLQIKTASVEQVTEEKKAHARELLAKIQIWKNTLEQREKVRIQEREKLEKKSFEYLERRSEGLCQEYLRRDVMPQIFSETKDQLFQFFKAPVTQKQYIDACLAKLTKENVRG